MFTFKNSSCDIVILDNIGCKNHIKSILRDYKTRWHKSLADRVGGRILIMI